MADPRFQVKPCPPQFAGRYEAEIGRQTSRSRDFFNMTGKIGDLEILNDVGGGAIGEGLRVLAGISDTVRNGCGSLPTSIGGVAGEILDEASAVMSNGVNWVLESLGLDVTMIEMVEAFDPRVANEAYGQAKQIYEMIRNGELEITDIPYILQDFQNLERLARKIYTPSSARGDRPALAERCEASPYAVDLISRHGKYQFLFVVEFVFNAPYTELGTLTFPFVVKKSSRPGMKYQMEDVNYYNYMTKAITRAEFDDITLTFHDDQQNETMRFFNAYMRSTSPITNIATANELGEAEEIGMDFGRRGQGIGASPGTTGQIESSPYAATTGPLNDGHKTVLSQINIYHVYGNGNFMNTMVFHKPRILQMSMNDLDMSASELGEITCVFNYDSIYIETDVPVTTQNSPTLEQARANPIYPLKYNDSARSVQGPNVGSLGGPPISQGIPDRCSPQMDTSTNVGTPGIMDGVLSTVAKSTATPGIVGTFSLLGGLF